MKKLMRCILLSTIWLNQSHVYAEESIPARDVELYIQAEEYQYPVKLWQYYQSVWVEQGPLIESAALKVFQDKLGKVGVCDEHDSSGKVLLWLRPKIFYNPQMLTFHGKVTVVAYTNDGKPVATYVAEASKWAFLEIQTKKQVDQVFTEALENIAGQMQKDEKFQTALHQTPASEKSACSLAKMFPVPQLQIMSF